MTAHQAVAAHKQGKRVTPAGPVLVFGDLLAVAGSYDVMSYRGRVVVVGPGMKAVDVGPVEEWEG